MKVLLAFVFIFCFYSFFHFLNVGYDFFKDLKGGTTISSKVEAEFYLKRQKSASSFITILNFLLFVAFAFVVFSGWLVNQIYSWWVIPITVFAGMLLGGRRRGATDLLDEYMRGAKRTLIAGIVVMMIVFVIWLIKQ